MSDTSADALAEERESLRGTVRTLLDRTSPETEVRRLMETESGYDETVWKQLSEQLGLTGLAIPEQYGGVGMTAMELAVVFEEFGRALYTGPFFATVGLAANLLLASADEAAKSEWLPKIAAGDVLATVALTEESSSWDLDSLAVTANQSGGEWRLSGSKWYVVDGGVADLILVVARADDGIGVFAVTGDADGLTREPMVTMDQTRKMARLTFAGTAAERLATPGAETVARGLQLAAVALAAENIGGAQRCLEMSAAYANERVQFGRPIGSFQAVKHKLANMLIEVEQAKSASYFAAREAGNDGEDLALAASLAKSYTSDVFVHAAADTIQIHGGIGFTWEHSAHLYFKRAKTNQLMLGSPAYHRELVADRIGI
ncbi:MAG TPA: acyl-CoA dehydrogenase family protein [Mycobacteriales bacterium]|nr:acyl-CoA dehydrogenase family protein [Mycobacteriales bacterium]